MFIVRPDMADEDLDKLISTLESSVTAAGGTVKSVDRMGKRRLAYMVRRFREGIYILLTVEGGGEVIHELERRLRVTEPVIKFLTVRIDEEQKRLEKIKKLRDARKKVSRRRQRRWRKKLRLCRPRKLRRRLEEQWPVSGGQWPVLAGHGIDLNSCDLTGH
jgi:small subunit ribosomal protein S6